MNDIHSQNEWKYIPRWLTAHFQSALQASPIVVMTGARQVGKSTFLQNAKPTRDLPFLTLDDLDVLDQAWRDPAALLSGKSKLIIDELQKAPGLLSEIKKAVDLSQRQLRIVVSGSANLLLKVSETLAGSAVLLVWILWRCEKAKTNRPRQF